MKTLLQIIIGPLPPELQPCIDSQLAFAAKNNLQVVTITEVPDKYKGFNLRAASDYMRLEYLAANPYTIYFDWDVLVPDNFGIVDPEDYCYGLYMDSVEYNGNRCDVFQSVLDIASVNIDNRHNELGIIYSSFYLYGIVQSKIISNYTHLNFSKGVSNGQ